MTMLRRILPCVPLGLVLILAPARAEEAGGGRYTFGPDQTIVEIGKLDWQPIKDMPAGFKSAQLRGDPATGGHEALVVMPPKSSIPFHSHTSDESYVWLQGEFTYIDANGGRHTMTPPVYVSLPGSVAHGLECGDNPCMFYARYSRTFNFHPESAPAH